MFFLDIESLKFRFYLGDMTFSPAGRRQTRPNFEFAARLGRHPRARTDSDSDRVLTGSESESAERLGMALV